MWQMKQQLSHSSRDGSGRPHARDPLRLFFRVYVLQTLFLSIVFSVLRSLARRHAATITQTSLNIRSDADLNEEPGMHSLCDACGQCLCTQYTHSSLICRYGPVDNIDSNSYPKVRKNSLGPARSIAYLMISTIQVHVTQE
jgi:hypothetical protein